jgi:hypothetical protein
MIYFAEVNKAARFAGGYTSATTDAAESKQL